MIRRQFFSIASAVCLLVGYARAGTVTITVLGTDNPFYAGQTQLDGTGPATYAGLPLTAGDALTFNVTGSVDYNGDTPTDPPDGQCELCTYYAFSTGATGAGISNVTAPVDALFGVFLSAADPTTVTAPARLDFTSGNPGSLGLAFTSLSPALQQVFFIGDGLTGNGTGTAQQFFVPAGATRLFFGMLDGSGWYNNTGQFSVTINDPSIVGNIGNPTPEPGTILLLGAGIVALGLVRRRAKASS